MFIPVIPASTQPGLGVKISVTIGGNPAKGDTPLHFKTLTEVAGLIESRQVSPVEVTETMLKRIEDFDGRSYAGANNLRSACNGLLRNVFENIDALACPSMTTPPDRVTPEELYGPMGEEDNLTWGRFTVPFDFNGAPTLSLPCGLNSDGLPLSLQFVGKHLTEGLLCRLGHAYEQATQWHNSRPNV